MIPDFNIKDMKKGTANKLEIEICDHNSEFLKNYTNIDSKKKDTNFKIQKV